MLARCRSVDEAVAFLRRTSIWWGGLWRHQIAFMIADSSGKSCMVDYVDRKMVVLDRNDSLQVLLNLHPTRHPTSSINVTVAARASAAIPLDMHFPRPMMLMRT